VNPIRTSVSAIFSPPHHAEVEEAAIGDFAESLRAAFDEVAPPIGPISPEPLENLSRAAAIDRLAQLRCKTVRPVRFVDPAWWRRDIGRVLAFRINGAPVALLPRASGHVVSDPQAGTVTPLDDASIASLDPCAFTFAPGNTRAPASITEWLRRLASGSLAASAEALSLAGCVLLIPLLTVAIVFTASRTPELSVSLLAALLVLAATLFWSLRHTATMRACLRLQHKGAELMHDLLVRFDTGTVRRWSPTKIFRGLDGLLHLERLVQIFLERGLPAAALLVVAIAAIGQTAGTRTAVIAMAGAALCGLIPIFVAWMGLLWTRPAIEAELSARRRLAVLLWGMMRLRLLVASARSFGRWIQQDEEHCALAFRARRLADAAAWLQPAVTLLLIGLLAASVHSGQAAVLVAALGWMVAVAALACGKSAAAVVADRDSRQAARALLAQPREEGSVTVDTATSMVTANRLTCHYPRVRAAVFTDLSLSIDPREVTVLAGPSGGGKSSLLRLLLGLQHPEAGGVFVAGHSIASIDTLHWRRRIAGIFQGEMLEATVTIRGQLSAQSKNSLSEIWEALETVEISEEIRRMPMGLQTIVEPGGISNGQQQRLLIARALLSHPALLVMDEATNAIPDAMQARILDRLRARGIGCLIVTHRETVIEAADVVHVIDGGIVFSGTQKEFAHRNDLKARMYAEQTA
jgi:ATP-binding cassette subfamily C protein